MGDFFMSKCKKCENENNEQKNEVCEVKADLAEDASLGRDKATDENQEGYNFMGTLHQWTTTDEQERKVHELQKVTDGKKCDNNSDAGNGIEIKGHDDKSAALYNDRKVKEIDQVAKDRKNDIEAAENNNHGQWTKK